MQGHPHSLQGGGKPQSLNEAKISNSIGTTAPDPDPSTNPVVSLRQVRPSSQPIGWSWTAKIGGSGSGGMRKAVKRRLTEDASVGRIGGYVSEGIQARGASEGPVIPIVLISLVTIVLGSYLWT
ncbi:hypothetical protein BJ508DRAFT_307338 [Ascobolus immersus RN42]|uniref:Uncharacterized protein n=1 Tax=Ascobolus immersus RN42 TaxID=1160509 RepID=A0A3N4I337_ASCIM|nr:hypothetical protein BJ508DRAFT_307338 [Ascobolus immersus RN42]